MVAQIKNRKSVGILALLVILVLISWNTFSATQAQSNPLPLAGPRVISQQTKFNYSDLGGGDPKDNFGHSVDISSDGLTAIVGNPGTNKAGEYSSAYVFVRDGDTWVEQARLIPHSPDGVWVNAIHVAISADGNTALVNIQIYDGGTETLVFVRSGTTWIEQANLGNGSEVAPDLSDDGNTALLFHSIGGVDAAYIFVRSGTVWTQQAQLLPSESIYYNQNLVLSGDGNTALVTGSPPGDEGADIPRVFVFARSGSTWTEETVLAENSTDGSYANFGASAALNYDGSLALIGIPYKSSDSSHFGTGAVFFFTRSGTTWTEQDTLTASDPTSGSYFGQTVSLDHDGTTALITNGRYPSGKGYIFTRSGMTWTQSADFQSPSPTKQDRFGTAGALSGDGNTALIGAFWDDNAIGEDAGAAYIYVHDGGNWIEQNKLTAGYLLEGELGDRFGETVTLSGDGNIAMIGSAYNDNELGANSGTVDVYRRSAAIWTLQTILKSPDNPNPYGSGFGNHIALSADGNTALIYGDYSVYVYVQDGTGWSLQQRITLPGNEGPLSLQISDDGNTALMSGVFSAFVFTRSGTIWRQQAQLTPIIETGAFWWVTALSGDGNIILMTHAVPDQNGEPKKGIVHVFMRSGTTWTEETTLTSNDVPDYSVLGSSLALNTDGSTAVIGAISNYGVNGLIPGSALVFTRIGSTWIQEAYFTTGDWQFGSAVAVNDAGTTALIGGHSDNVAYLFNKSNGSWSQNAEITAAGGILDEDFGWAVALNGDGTTLLIGAPGRGYDESATTAGAAYIFYNDGISATATPTDAGTAEATPTEVVTEENTPMATDAATSTVPATATLAGTEASTPTATDTPVSTEEATPTFTTTPSESAGEELLTGGNFEIDLNGDKIPDGWTQKNPTHDKLKCTSNNLGSRASDVHSLVAVDGNCVYQFKGGIGEHSKLQQPIDQVVFNLQTGDTIRFGGMVYAKQTVDTQAKVIVKYTDTLLTKDKIVVSITVPTDGYQPFSSLTDHLEITLKGAPSKLKVQLMNKATAGKVRYDVLTLQKIEGVLSLPGHQ